MKLQGPLLSAWQTSDGAQGVGDASLLDRPLTAFFASRQCSGVAIRAAMEWAVTQARGRTPVISGFHSSLEQSVLKVMLTAGGPCVMVIARPIEQARLPASWLRAVQEGTAAVISMESASNRLTAECAARRNDWVAGHADRIVVAYASPEGNLMPQIAQWEHSDKPVTYLVRPRSGDVPSGS